MSGQKIEKSKNSVLCKIVVCGAAASGKTALLYRFVTNKFQAEYRPTIGAGFVSKTIPLDGECEEVNLQVWDSAGQEHFLSSLNTYLRGTDLAVVTLHLSKASAIEDADKFVDRLKGADIPIVVIVGTKSDLPRAEGLTQEAIDSFVKETADRLKADVSYQATSAKDSKGVDELFQSVAKKVYKLPQNVDVEQPKQPAGKRNSDCAKASFFKRHQTSMVVGGVAVGSVAGLLYGLVLSAMISAPLAIGIGCALAALALLVVAGKALYDHHQQRQTYASI